MNKKIKILIILLFVMLFANSMSKVDAFAQINPQQQSQLTLVYPIKNTEFYIYKVADISNKGIFTPTSDFKEYSLELNYLNNNQWQQLSETISSYVSKDNIKHNYKSEVTNKGSIVFENLDEGLYLVKGKKIVSEGNIYTPIDTLVSVPSRDDNQNWIYNVSIAPKYEIIPYEENETTEENPITKPEKPTKDNQGDIEGGPDKLPQTGMVWWPVPILAMLGLLMVAIGWRHSKQSELEDEEAK